MFSDIFSSITGNISCKKKFVLKLQLKKIVENNSWDIGLIYVKIDFWQTYEKLTQKARMRWKGIEKNKIKWFLKLFIINYSWAFIRTISLFR